MMTEKHLNNYMLLHIHKEIADDLDLVQVAQKFIYLNDKHKKYFSSFIQWTVLLNYIVYLPACYSFIIAITLWTCLNAYYTV